MAAKLAPKRLINRLITKRLTVNKATLASLANAKDFLSKTATQRVAQKVVTSYRKRLSKLVKDGATKGEALLDAVNKNKLLVQRVQDSVTAEIAEEIKDGYRGEQYEWLPSDANEPDPLHQLKYGKIFKVGVGEMPGDRHGCRCGMRILVPEERIEL